MESRGHFLPHKVPYFNWKTPVGQDGFCGLVWGWLGMRGLG